MTLNKVRLADCCIIKPPKSEAKELIANEELVSFVPMSNLGIDTPDLLLDVDKKLSDVIGSYTYFKDNDVLLAKITPCFENGKLGVAKGLTNGIGFGSSEFIVFRSKGNVVPEYLYYYLLQQRFRDVGKSVMTGAVGHKRVPKDYIENSEIPLPSLEEQKQILVKLDQAFSDIDKAKIRAEKNLINARELFESYLQQSISENTNDDIVFALGDLGKITSSKRIFKKEYVEEGIPFYRTKEIKQLANQRDISTELFISEERYQEIKCNNGVPSVHDVLLTAIGTIGEIFVVEDDSPFYFKDGNVLWLKDFSSVNSYFLKYALMAFVTELRRLSRGAAYNALPIQKLKNYKINVPPMEEQLRIVSKLEQQKNTTKKLEQIYIDKISLLDELKQAILQRAFNGELA
jgi:type I restriction enzyme S subunit